MNETGSRNDRTEQTRIASTVRHTDDMITEAMLPLVIGRIFSVRPRSITKRNAHLRRIQSARSATFVKMKTSHTVYLN